MSRFFDSEFLERFNTFPEYLGMLQYNYTDKIEAYKNAVSSLDSYLLVDMRSETDENQQLRTCIFPDELNFVYQ